MKEPLYKDTTNFSFFTKQALAKQTGIKDSPFALDLSNQERNGKSGWKSVQLKAHAPVTPDDPACNENSGIPSKALRMVNTTELLLPKGGNYRNGYVRTTKTVDPEEWFFHAHFYQDPVCPGTQTLRYLKLRRKSILMPMAYSREGPTLWRNHPVPSITRCSG